MLGTVENNTVVAPALVGRPGREGISWISGLQIMRVYLEMWLCEVRRRGRSL